MAEELVLTVLVLVYGIFVGWVIAVDFWGFRLITDYCLMIVPLMIIGLGYGFWAQNKLKKNLKHISIR